MFKAAQEIDRIYDANGAPVLRLLDNGRLVGFDGSSIGFLNQGNVYDYNGIHRGWFHDGILRDHFGACVGFGQQVTTNTHPFFPFKQLAPLPSLVELEPLRPFKSFPPFKPFFGFQWSDYDPISLFEIYP